MRTVKFLILCMVAVFACTGMALAAEKNKYYCTDKVKGYQEGHFVVMDSDEVNLRQAPEDGKIIKVLGRHSLLQVLDAQKEWYKVKADGTVGYVYAPFTGECKQDMLTEEDFSLGYATLGKVFTAEDNSAQLGALKDTVKKDGRIYYKYDLGTIGVHKRKKYVEYIEVKDPKVITMRGVSIGDDSERVVGQYGVPATVIYGDDENIYEYYFEDQDDKEYYFAVKIDKAGIVTSWVIENLD